MVRLILALLFLSGCGRITVEVQGHVDVNHNLNLQDLWRVLHDECKTKKEGDKCYNPNVDICADCLMADFLEHF